MHFELLERFKWMSGAARRAEIAAEAESLIAKFKDQAYYEARDRVRGRCVDGTRSARYWTGVKREIAKRQGIAIGLAGADMWA
jgi:hypothetical protein